MGGAAAAAAVAAAAADELESFSLVRRGAGADDWPVVWIGGE